MIGRRFGTHYRVMCVNCRHDAEVCCKRLDGEGAERMALAKLRKAGWHVDGFDTSREKWFCPQCARKPHL